MTDNQAEEFLTGSIDDYLLAVADGIHQAQLQLSRMRIPAQPGQPSIMYQLPRVDFELKMSFEISRTSADDGGAARLALRARPISPLDASAQSATAGAASVIKGSFVAVPSEGGKPPMIIRSQIERMAARTFTILVTVQSATGDSQAGVEVQFNLDREQSQRINRLVGLENDLQPGTQVWLGKVATSSQGQASTTLEIDEKEADGTHVAVIIDVAGETETIIFKAGQ